MDIGRAGVSGGKKGVGIAFRDEEFEMLCLLFRTSYELKYIVLLQESPFLEVDARIFG